jgi:GT2 family glycosyltransferase
VDIDVADGVPDLRRESRPFGTRYVFVLVRMFTEPIGAVVLAAPRGELSREQLIAGIEEALGGELRAAAGAAGAIWPPGRHACRLPSDRLSPFLAARRAALVNAPRVTVVVCTRENPAGLRRCLESLGHLEYPDFSVLVVDNAPLSNATRSVVAMAQQAVPIRIDYVVEPVGGLSWVSHCVFEHVEDQIIAWIDDDEIADRFWLAEIIRGFFEHPEAGVVSGVMLPAQLETAPQVQFEQYGGHHKHRGFVGAVFSPESAASQSPLYPLPPFGTGGNMAFRLATLVELGGFDPALGAGTLSLGAEDTRAFTEVLLRGGTVVYQPSAITFHFHRAAAAALRRQMFGYGVGLTAFYAGLILERPRRLAELLRLIPLFLRDAFGSASLRSGDLPPGFPSDLRWANRGGLVAGPLRYLLARAIARRQSRRRRTQSRPS